MAMRFPLNKDLLQRYAREGDTIIIDVAARHSADLYNHFDQLSPHVRKDLRDDLVSYLVECGREIGDHPCRIRISLDNPATLSLQDRVRRSFSNYFCYLVEAESIKMLAMARKSLILFALGLALIAIAVAVNQRVEDTESVFARVVAEGITVAAWVSLWEALATFLVQWSPHRRDQRLYRHLANTPVEMVASTGPVYKEDAT